MNAPVVAADAGDALTATLLTAARNGDVTRVRHLLENTNVHVDSFDDDHVTALQLAAAGNHLDIAQLLLDRGANIERCNQVGMTPFLHACRHGHWPIVDLLLLRGAKTDRVTYLGASAVALASAGGHYSLVKRLLGLCLGVETRSGLCPTPLIAATLYNRPDICALLVSRGAAVDLTLSPLLGLNALATVVICNLSPLLLDQLLDLGADPAHRFLKERSSACELARQFGRTDHSRILERCGGVARNMHMDSREKLVDIKSVIAQNDLTRLRALIDGREQYAPLLDGTTPLMYAVLAGNFPAVKLLVEAGKTDVNAMESISRMTALMQAIVAGQNEIAKYLLANGADVSIVSSSGYTARDLALLSDASDAELICMMMRQMAYGGQLQSPDASSSSGGGGKNKKANWLRKIANRVVGSDGRCSTNSSLDDPTFAVSSGSTGTAIGPSSLSGIAHASSDFADAIAASRELDASCGEAEDPVRLFVTCDEMLTSITANGMPPYADRGGSAVTSSAAAARDPVCLARKSAAALYHYPGMLRPNPIACSSRPPFAETSHSPFSSSSGSSSQRGNALALHFSRWDHQASRTMNAEFGSSSGRPPTHYSLAQRNAALYCAEDGDPHHPSISALGSLHSGRKDSDISSSVFSFRASYDANGVTNIRHYHKRGGSADQAAASPNFATAGLGTVTRRMRSQAFSLSREENGPASNSPYSANQFAFALPRQKTQRSLSSPSLCNGHGLSPATPVESSPGALSSSSSRAIVESDEYDSTPLPRLTALMDNMEITITESDMKRFKCERTITPKVARAKEKEPAFADGVAGVSAVCAMLVQIGLGDYCAAFRDNEVDMDVLCRIQGGLSDNDFQELGVATADRKRIIDEARRRRRAPLRRAVPPPPPSYGLR